jgi:predicted amidohydrolase
VTEACAKGAQLVALPENVSMLEPNTARMKEKAEQESQHTALRALSKLAQSQGCWLLVGSLAVRVGEVDRVANRSYLIDAKGEVRTHYDKIHLFDVNLGGGEAYRESDYIRPGDQAVISDTPWGRLGMSVCYDLRFPHLYRALAKNGADFLSIPAAFTRTTGEAHWHVLLRARAIETGCYVIAPGQCGTHAEGRQTYGHSLIVDPWGTVLADGGHEPSIVYATIDPAEVARARGRVPALYHDRAFAMDPATDPEDDRGSRTGSTAMASSA